MTLVTVRWVCHGEVAGGAWDFSVRSSRPQQAWKELGDISLCVCQMRHRISSLLQEAKTQAALVLDSLEARKE